MWYLNYLTSFLSVYRTCSFSLSAEELHLTQPTISQHISSLEKKFNKKLFTRTSRKVIPTIFAEQLATRISDNIDNLTSLFTELEKSDLTRSISLGAEASYIQFFLMDKLTYLIQQGLKLHTTMGVIDELLKELQQARIDCAIGPFRNGLSMIDAIPIGEQCFDLLGNEYWLSTFRAQKVITDDFLLKVPWIIFFKNHPVLKEYLNQAFGFRKKLAPALVIRDEHCIQSAIVQGIGIAVLPRYLGAPLVREKKLFKLCDDTSINVSLPIYLYYRSQAKQTYPLSELIRLCSATCPSRE